MLGILRYLFCYSVMFRRLAFFSVLRCTPLFSSRGFPWCPVGGAGLLQFHSRLPWVLVVSRGFPWAGLVVCALKVISRGFPRFPVVSRGLGL